MAHHISSLARAYIWQQGMAISDIPDLFATLKTEIEKLFAPAATEPEKLTPPVPIKKTITPDHIISLEDGKPYKSLKRHLSTRGLTPEDYRRKWGLPHDYPMVAANYAAQRSELAKSIGLGQIRRQQTAARKAQVA
ncbi:MucR family transcriptional regulator [Methylobacterium indicum]|uniref:MucR family transcriptional regulator n=1 Tax=Methylobacterium indicum TaxID=1775910 RepID=A0ABR5HER8_9HYPH|nr:MucR family transcriptional regulator [Methylobacterium indicum]KMO25064.1 MucR family transcriptional regulator [Methylobacterium indicum]